MPQTNAKPGRARNRRAPWTGIGATLALFAGIARAQQPGQGGVLEGSNLKFAEFYDPPHASQMKSLVEGARAQRQPDGRILFTDAKLHTFRENGEGEMIVEAPQCLHDASQKTLSSAGPLRMRTADGNFYLEGEGFLWRQTNSALFISNRVHTLIQPGLGEAKSALTQTNFSRPRLGEIEIVSDQFDYIERSGFGTYRGAVNAAGTNLALSSEVLVVAIPMSEPRKPSGLQSITAETNVVIDYAGFHTTGDRAAYSTESGLANITGHPAWSAGPREGRADELIIDRTNQVFRALGHAWFKMPVQTNNASGFLPQVNTAPAPASAFARTQPPATNQFVEISSESYELRTNLATFTDQVRLIETANHATKVKMSCGVLKAFFVGTNELQRMEATDPDRVIIEQEDQRFISHSVTYESTNGIMDLVGDPSWQDGPRSGKGDHIQVHVPKSEMEVTGNASMRLPATELGESGPAQKTAPPPATTNSATNQFADIFSTQYTVNPTSAFFYGSVRVDHPRLRMTCGQMAVSRDSENEKNSQILAEQKVVFDLNNEQGQTMHGSGEKVVYTYKVDAAGTNDLMTLTGNPVLTTTNGTFRNSVIMLDRANKKLYAPGKYHMQGTATAVNTTILHDKLTK